MPKIVTYAVKMCVYHVQVRTIDNKKNCIDCIRTHVYTNVIMQSLCFHFEQWFRCRNRVIPFIIIIIETFERKTWNIRYELNCLGVIWIGSWGDRRFQVYQQVLFTVNDTQFKKIKFGDSKKCEMLFTFDEEMSICLACTLDEVENVYFATIENVPHLFLKITIFETQKFVRHASVNARGCIGHRAAQLQQSNFIVTSHPCGIYVWHRYVGFVSDYSRVFFPSIILFVAHYKTIPNSNNSLNFTNRRFEQNECKHAFKLTTKKSLEIVHINEPHHFHACSTFANHLCVHCFPLGFSRFFRFTNAMAFMWLLWLSLLFLSFIIYMRDDFHILFIERKLIYIHSIEGCTKLKICRVSLSRFKFKPIDSVKTNEVQLNFEWFLSIKACTVHWYDAANGRMKNEVKISCSLPSPWRFAITTFRRVDCPFLWGQQKSVHLSFGAYLVDNVFRQIQLLWADVTWMPTTFCMRAAWNMHAKTSANVANDSQH